MTKEINNSLARGAKLTKESFEDFKNRLHYDCRGEGVRDHCTANAVFLVQENRMICGLDAEYGEKLAYDTSGDFNHWFSPEEYWESTDDEERDELDLRARNLTGEVEDTFLGLDEDTQWDILDELPDIDIGYYKYQWTYVNSHFTRDAALAFIRRKAHDYGALRVYVDSSYHSWELNEIRDAIIDGCLVFKEKTDV